MNDRVSATIVVVVKSFEVYKDGWRSVCIDPFLVEKLMLLGDVNSCNLDDLIFLEN